MPKVVFSTVFIGVIPAVVVACGDDKKPGPTLLGVAACMNASCGNPVANAGFGVADAAFRHDGDASDSGDGADGDLDGSDADVGAG